MLHTELLMLQEQWSPPTQLMGVAGDPELAILCWGQRVDPFISQPCHLARGAVGLGKDLKLGGIWS